MIRYVRHAEIDQEAWDARLERAPNKLWYGLASVLNAASPGWDALIDEELDVQLPLTWRSKYGVRYIYRPFLLQQFGPFGPGVDAALAERFVHAVPRKFKHADIYLCAGPATAPFAVQQNITLSLANNSDALRAGYSENLRRNLKKVDPASMRSEERSPADELQHFFGSSTQFKQWGITQDQKRTMHQVFRVAVEQGHARTYGMRAGKELVAGAFFVQWGGRLIFLKGLASERGRELRAMHALIDRVITEHAGRPLLLDFAGSNDPQLARFYQGFGGVPAVYLRALIERLPLILRMLRP